MLFNVRDGILGQLVQEPTAKAAIDLDCADDPILGELFPSCRSLLAIPVLRAGRPQEWVVFLSKLPVGFTPSSSERVATIGYVIQSQLEVIRLRDQLEQIQEEISSNTDRLAAIQRALLLCPKHPVPGLDVAAHHEARLVAGGDMYGILVVDADNDARARTVAMLIGDVCGHDVSSTVVMAMAAAILHCYPQVPARPSDVLKHLNERLCNLNLPPFYATVFLGFLSLDTRRLTYCRAGHPCPLVRHPDGTVQTLEGRGGFPLGVFEDARCEDSTEIIPEGSAICMYTDGITDTRSPADVPFGVGALKRTLKAANGHAESAVADIVMKLRKHQGHAPLSDDRALLLVKTA
jgi:serine phosphatase RsbU (regulator of sigma subunit)